MVAAAIAGAFALAGCQPEEHEARKAPREPPAPIASTSEQVQRLGKKDRLATPAPQRLASARPQQPEPPRPEPDKTAPEESAPPPVAEAPTQRKPLAAPPAPRYDPALARFHRALRELESGERLKPVTILHLGNSHIAADRFTGDLREMFQARFGDAGRGLMLPGFPFPYYRADGIRFAKRGPWTEANSVVGEEGPYGVTGVRLATRAKDARLSLTSVEGPFEWAEVTFLTGPGQGTAIVAVDAASRRVETRARTRGTGRVRIEHKGISLLIRTEGDGAVTVLSWAVGYNRPGIRYVNLGIPGATAETPGRWDADIVRAELAQLDPDLVVLGYGTNEGFDDRLDVAAYEARVNALARTLLRAAPRATLAVIGPPNAARFPRYAIGRDRASCRPLSEAERRDYGEMLQARAPALARWHAPPNLGPVRAALKRVAARHKAHFWNWAAVMGDACAVHDWAHAEPKLAMGDHVHFTADGARLSATQFFASLMAGYDQRDRLARPAATTRKRRTVR